VGPGGLGIILEYRLLPRSRIFPKHGENNMNAPIKRLVLAASSLESRLEEDKCEALVRAGNRRSYLGGEACK